jgi:hypothetical protein
VLKISKRAQERERRGETIEDMRERGVKHTDKVLHIESFNVSIAPHIDGSGDLLELLCCSEEG